MKTLGIISCGHEETAKAAESILREGGNAFDAVVAAHLTACVAEPVLSSLGGGGFLLAKTPGKEAEIYDFFVQTPGVQRAADELEFYPISADFGTARQEFHIGYGSAAVPGTVKGLFAIHRDHCTLPMERLVAPAVAAARRGVVLNEFQAYVFDIVKPILFATQAARAIFASRQQKGQPLRAGERYQAVELADTLEALAQQGEALFYAGEIAELIVHENSQHGGHLTTRDLNSYEVVKRRPLSIDYRGTTILSNPPPSSGGILIGFALKLIENAQLSTLPFGSANHLGLLAKVMVLTQRARLEAHLEEPVVGEDIPLLEPSYLARFEAEIRGHAQAPRGTTHITVLDSEGNVASLSTSNGEGCGHILPHTGVMLNNMLGEQDLSPHGFHGWPPAQRMTSMMAPTLLLRPNEDLIALGSGGSNRIRTAILQVVLNLIEYHMPLERAVTSPRCHLEDNLLSVESGFQERELAALAAAYPNQEAWPQRSLFFGGVHAVAWGRQVQTGCGDPRRGGVATVVYR